MPPGLYRIQAGYFPDDGWFSENDQLYMEVRDQDLSDVRIHILPAVTTVNPAHGATVSTGQPRFTWHPVPGADRYRVAYSPANGFLLTGGFIETTDTTTVMRAGVWGDGDHGRWAVYAYRDGAVVAGPEVLTWLVVDSR